MDLKFWVEEVERLHFLVSETKVLNSGGVTAELIGIFV